MSVQAADSITSLQEEILAALANDELLLPSMPETALSIRQAAEDPEISITEICELVSADAAIAVRIIQIANSPLFRAIKPIETLQTAIARMGIKYSCNFAVGIAMEQLFQATSDAVDSRMRASWSHSINVASLCQVYCAHFTALDPGQATLAGLVHGIGKLPILTWADENDWDEAQIDQTSDILHCTLGERILAKWEFPEQLRQVPAGYLDFERESDGVDYVDLVCVANLIAHRETNHSLARVDLKDVTAFEHLGIDVDEISDHDELSNEAEEARSLLS